MSASSFERALRDRAGCDPEPQARLNAKRAALEAFARRQAQGPSPDEEEGPRRFAPPTRYVGGRSRSESCFAGAASAAISGIGVLLLWAHAGTRVPPLEPFVVHLIPAAVIQYEVALPNVPAAPTRSARFEPSPPKPRSVVRAAPATSNSVRRVAEEPVSTVSIDVDAASYSHTTVAVMASPWTARNKLVHIGITGYEPPAHDQPDAKRAKDMKIQVEFNPATVSQYRLVGYEARASEGRFDDDAHTVTAIYEIKPTEPATRSGDADLGKYGDLRIQYEAPDGRSVRLLEQPILVDVPVLSPPGHRSAFAESAREARIAQGF